MNKEFLKQILSIPTCSKHETRLIEFLVRYALDNKIEFKVDVHGNVFYYKGELEDGEFRPCVVAHTDTVHYQHRDLIAENTNLIIREEIEDFQQVLKAYHPTSYKQTGIGGDDKAGVFVALELFNKYDKIMAAFFVSEEIGCIGSKAADISNFDKVGWFIQFDAPFNNWVSKSCNGVILFDDKFQDNISDILAEHGQTNISYDPYTDVYALRPKTGINCINIFAGYMKMHTSQEYVVLEFVQQSIDLGDALIKHLGNSEYKFS